MRFYNTNPLATMPAGGRSNFESLKAATEIRDARPGLKTAVRSRARFTHSNACGAGLPERPGSAEPSTAGAKDLRARSASRLGFSQVASPAKLHRQPSCIASQVALCEKASIHTKGPFAKVFTHLEKESDSQTHLEGTSRED